MRGSRLTLVCLAAAAGVALPAQADDGVAVGPMMCLYGYGDYRPCADEAGPAPGPQSAAEIAPADPLQDYRRRYTAAVLRLQHVVDGLQDVSAAEPQSLDEMSARLSVLYVGGAFRLDSIAAARGHAAQVTARAAESIAAQSGRIQSFKVQMASAATRKAAAISRLDALTPEQRRLDTIKGSLERRRVELAGKADQTTILIGYWLAIAGVPKAQRPQLPLTRQRPVVDDYMPSFLMAQSAGPAFVVPDTPRLPASSTLAVDFRPAPAGTIDERLSAVERLAPRIEAASRALAGEFPAAAQAAAEADALDIALRTTTQLYRDVEGEVHDATSRADSAKAIRDYTRQDCATAALNMLREAIEVTILNRLKTKAQAAVKEFVTVNADAKAIAILTDEKVAAMYKAGQLALHLPAGARFKEMDKFLEEQRAILAYVNNPLESAMAGATALGNGNPNSGSEEALVVFRGLRRDALQFAETSSKSLPAGPREFAMRLLDESDAK